MSLTEFILKVLNKISVTRRLGQGLMRRLILSDFWRVKVNRLYLHLNYQELKIFHTFFAKLFSNTSIDKFSAFWNLKFADAEIKFPLDDEDMWLKWETAVSIIGHDIEIKEFYERIIQSDKKPRVFFDVGANYGTHSILFLANEIRAISFEPNPDCLELFQETIQANNLKYEWHQIALSDKKEALKLTFPKKDTWLGMVSHDGQNEFQGLKDLKTIDIEAITLDEFSKKNDVWPDLIKIDTEGFEINVLEGSRRCIEKSKPTIIFESIEGDDREKLLDFFSSVDYAISDMASSKSLNKESFINTKSRNFLAVKVSISNKWVTR